LDPKLGECFDAVERLFLCPEAYATATPSPQTSSGSTDPAAAGPAVPQVARYQLSLETGNWDSIAAVVVRLGLKDGSWRLLASIPQGEPVQLKKNSTYTMDVTSGESIGIDPREVQQVRVEQQGDDWEFKGIRIDYAPAGGDGLQRKPLYAKRDEQLIRYFDRNGWTSWISDTFTVAPETAGTGPTPMTGGSGPAPIAPSQWKDACCARRLIAHIYDNVVYYSRIVWLRQDSDERAIMLREALAARPDLIATIDSSPITVSGRYVVYASNRPLSKAESAELSRRAEAIKPKQGIVSLPARGVFAETQLSKCNSCEKRDVTRFWDWTESPCPGDAPAVEDIAPGPRGAPATVEPGVLPSPVVQITQPPAAPDPVGMAAALALLGKGDTFRDMSGGAELQQLLSGLTSGAVDLAKARELAKQVQANQRSGGARPAGTNGAKPQTPQQRYDNLQVAKETDAEAKKLGMGQERREDLFENAIADGAGGSSRGQAQIQPAGGPVAAAAAGAVAQIAVKLAEPVIKEMFNTAEGRYFHLESGAALLEGYPIPADYLSLPDEQMIPVSLTDVGGTIALDGLDAKLRITWNDCTLKPERIKKSDRGRGRQLLSAICKKNISVRVERWSMGSAITFAEVKPTLVVPETTVMLTINMATGAVEPQPLRAYILLAVTVTPRSPLLGGSSAPIAAPALQIPLRPDMFSHYEVMNGPDGNSIEGHMWRSEWSL
jgi:hypothetical protein